MTRSEALAFLTNLGRELSTQDGMDDPMGPKHGSAWPVYHVKQKVRIYGIDSAFADPDGWETLDSGDEVSYVERLELVQGAVSLTRSGIEAYLRANGHNLREPQIYIGSMHRVQAMRDLITALRTLGARTPTTRGDRMPTATTPENQIDTTVEVEKAKTPTLGPSGMPAGLTGPGIVTVSNWTMAPSGRRYCYFWAPSWKVVNDAELASMVGLESFRSSERWQLIALDHDAKVAAVFPGCQIKAWISADRTPNEVELPLYAF